MHPVLESLRNTDRQWLIDTLYAFNSGNVETFQALKSAWGQQVSERVMLLQARLGLQSLLRRCFNLIFLNLCMGVILIIA